MMLCMDGLLSLEAFLAPGSSVAAQGAPPDLRKSRRERVADGLDEDAAAAMVDEEEDAADADAEREALAGDGWEGPGRDAGSARLPRFSGPPSRAVLCGAA